MSKVWELDLPSTQKLVLLAMADHANDFGRQCFPSIEHLAWKSGCSERSVQRLIRELEAVGIVVTTRRSRGGRNKVNQYWIRPEKGKKLEPLRNHDKLSGFEDERQIEQETPSSATLNPDTVSPEPSVNHQETLVGDPHAQTLARAAWTHALGSTIPDKPMLRSLVPVALVNGVLTLRAGNSWQRDQAREKWQSTIVAGLVGYGVVDVRIVAGGEQ